MFKTKNDLSDPARKNVIELLNARLADCIDLQTQAKQAHWNVKGPHFIALHELFDKINEEVEDYIDEIAERAVQLGGVAEGTARIAAKKSNLPEYPLDAANGRSHVDALSTALASFGTSARKAIEEASDFGDLDSADLFTEISRGIDKWLWFVEAHYREKPNDLARFSYSNQTFANQDSTVTTDSLLPKLPPVVAPPFTLETATLKVRLAEDSWNSRDPERVALAYTEESVWRNRSEYLTGRDAIRRFLAAKWERELEYRLVKSLWGFRENRMAVRFQYEWHDAAGQWFRSYGNELWEFDERGLMQRREASINDVAILEIERKFFWPAPGPRPLDHPGIPDLL